MTATHEAQQTLMQAERMAASLRGIDERIGKIQDAMSPLEPEDQRFIKDALMSIDSRLERLESAINSAKWYGLYGAVIIAIGLYLRR